MAMQCRREGLPHIRKRHPPPQKQVQFHHVPGIYLGHVKSGDSSSGAKHGPTVARDLDAVKKPSLPSPNPRGGGLAASTLSSCLPCPYSSFYTKPSSFVSVLLLLLLLFITLLPLLALLLALLLLALPLLVLPRCSYRRLSYHHCSCHRYRSCHKLDSTAPLIFRTRLYITTRRPQAGTQKQQQQ